MTILSVFRKPTAHQIAVEDLEEAKREYLSAVQHAEYYAALAGFYDTQIARLTNYVKESTE